MAACLTTHALVCVCVWCSCWVACRLRARGEVGGRLSWTNFSVVSLDVSARKTHNLCLLEWNIHHILFIYWIDLRLQFLACIWPTHTLWRGHNIPCNFTLLFTVAYRILEIALNTYSQIYMNTWNSENRRQSFLKKNEFQEAWYSALSTDVPTNWAITYQHDKHVLCVGSALR